MWFNRDFQAFSESVKALPVKVLKGPRQVGKTSLLEKLNRYKVIYFDDLHIRQQCQQNPKLFFDQYSGPLVLDEATMVPNLFSELKRRVDQNRREGLKTKLDYWITGSNQTLLQKNIRESLAGRASYFDLNTLSLHELSDCLLSQVMLRGGWPELHTDPELDPVRYINDLILTFIEKDIVAAAGIERREAFSRSLHLLSGRVGQLVNASDIAQNVGVDTTTVQSWTSLLELNGLILKLESYHTNLNQRLIKSPKIYFQDVGLASRLQGWSDFLPLMNSPQFGHLVENLAISEVSKFFSNRGSPAKMFFLRSKEKIEIDLLIELPNQRFIGAEIKVTPRPWDSKQHDLINSLKLNVIEKWVLTPSEESISFNEKIVSFKNIWTELDQLWK